jgi:1-phosphofructokinase family hexose kinase
MIYSLTLNPTLDITYTVDEIEFGEAVRALEVTRTPGGKGINVSRALRAMGTDSVAMSMVGGRTGEEVLDLLQNEGLIMQIVRIKNETRTNVIVLGKKDGKELLIRAAGPPVEKTETERISNLVFQIAQVPEILVLSGSLPPGTQDDIYFSIAKEGKARGSRVIIDCEGRPLARAVEAAPYLIKPNRAEFAGLAGRGPLSRREIIEEARRLNARGVEVVVVSLGREGALLVAGEIVLQGTVPEVGEDTVGAGDSMVAGLAMGLVQSLPLERVFHIGLAFSVSAVMNRGPGLTEPETFASVFPEITVEPVEEG